MKAVAVSLPVAVLLGVSAGASPRIHPPRDFNHPAPADRYGRTCAALARQGAVDRLVVYTCGWHVPIKEDAFWQPVLDLATSIRFAGKPKPERFPTVASYEEYQGIRFSRPHAELAGTGPEPFEVLRGRAVAADEIEVPDGLQYNFVITRGDVRSEKYYSYATIFSLGNVTTQRDCLSTIIVADGNIVVNRNVRSSILIATGDITVGPVTHSTMIAGGSVNLEYEAYRSPGAKNVIESGPKRPKHLVTFFELDQIGVTAELADKEFVRLAKLAPDSPLAHAGVREGDVVLKAGDAKLLSVDQFRRAMRDAVVLRRGTLTVRRPDKSEAVCRLFPE